MVELCEDAVWSGMGWSWEDLIDYWPEVLEKSCNLLSTAWAVGTVILHAVYQRKSYENSTKQLQLLQPLL